MTPADLQAALDAATLALREDELSPAAERFAISVTRLVAYVSALRDVLAQTERERDEACARHVRATQERDVFVRRVRWTECRESLTHSSLDFTHGVERDALRDDMRAYGALLRTARGSTSLADASDAVGCSVPDLSGVERARLPPFNEATTRRLCAFLGCDPGPLLDAAAKCEEAMR